MDNLRWILIVVALVVIAVVYFLGQKKKNITEYLPEDEIDEVPSFNASNEVNDEWVDGVGPVKILNDEAAKANDAPEEVIGASIDESIQGPDYVIDNPVDRPLVKSDGLVEPVVKLESDPVAEVEADDVVSVYVLAAKDSLIKGEQILSSSYALKLIHGDMKIFHRHSDVNNKIQFSMANIQDPGWFDIENMHEMKTKGVSFFMQVNLVDDASDVLDEMLISAHKLSSMLGATLCGAQRQPLDVTSTKDLRDKVKRLEDLKIQLV